MLVNKINNISNYPTPGFKENLRQQKSATLLNGFKIGNISTMPGSWLTIYLKANTSSAIFFTEITNIYEISFGSKILCIDQLCGSYNKIFVFCTCTLQVQI